EYPSGDRQPRRRRAGAVGFARGGLDLQHPRRRCRAHAAAPVLRAGAEGRPPDRVHRPSQTLQQHARPSRTDRRRQGARRATVEALETFRRDTGALKDVSFPTIAGTGPNGAIVHYRVTRKTNRRIARGDLLLIDSGAQYEDGTTDVTRTIAVGEPSEEMRDRF